MTRPSLWHHNGNQDVTKEAAVTMVCGHAFHNGWLKKSYKRFSAYTHPNLQKFNRLWGIMIEWKLIPRFRSLWCHQRPGKLTTMTSILVSIPISMTLNQGIEKIIQCISPDLCFLCPKYIRSSSNGLNERRKSLCGGRSGSILKH